jgi:hypothetical protein
MYASDVKILIKQPRAFLSWTGCNPDLFSQRASKLFTMHPIGQDTPVVMASKKAQEDPLHQEQRSIWVFVDEITHN